VIHAEAVARPIVEVVADPSRGWKAEARSLYAIRCRSLWRDDCAKCVEDSPRLNGKWGKQQQNRGIGAQCPGPNHVRDEQSWSGPAKSRK